MSDATLSNQQAILGDVVAIGVSEADYMEQYAESHHEWVNGIVIKMSPISLTHEFIVIYLRELLRAYVALQPTAIVLGEPFVMRLPDSRREPDLMVICGDNRANLKETYMDGPADICIEVVSKGSVSVDYGEKLSEYERGGVGEYWLIDPIRAQAFFYRLNAEGLYQVQPLDAEDNYQTPKLPRFKLHVPTLWTSPLPNYAEVWQAIQAMLG